MDALRKISCVLLLLLFKAAWAEKEAGLVISGVSFLSTAVINGQLKPDVFDFILQRTCDRDATKDQDCFGHVGFNREGANTGFFLRTDGNRTVSLGKTNFDSVNAAPPDSEMVNSQYVFSLQPDSLKAAVGNVYALKTAVDPRREYPLYAKLKVLGFKVIDAEKHELEMRFLWAANKTGYRDLQTAGLDTFDLETPTVARMSPMPTRMGNMVMPRAKVVFSRDGKGTPAVLVQPGGGRAVWVDLRGRGGEGRE